MRKGFYEHLIAFRRPLEIWEELVLCAGDATFGLSNTWCARLAVFASWVAPLALVEPLPHGFGRELPKLSIQPWPVTVGHAAGLPALAPTKDSRSAPNPAWGTELEPIARWSASSPWLLRLGRLYREACPFTTPTVQGGASQHHSAAAMSSGTEQRHWPPASSGFFPERRRGLEEEVRFAAPRHILWVTNCAHSTVSSSPTEPGSWSCPTDLRTCRPWRAVLGSTGHPYWLTSSPLSVRAHTSRKRNPWVLLIDGAVFTHP